MILFLKRSKNNAFWKQKQYFAPFSPQNGMLFVLFAAFFQTLDAIIS